MRLIITVLALLFLGSLTTACNTMEGLGKDIKKGGQNLEDTAEKHK